MNNHHQIIKTALDILSKETQELYLPPEIDELFEVPSSLEFLRNYVSKNLPVVIRNATKDMPCVEKWSSDFLKEKLKDKIVNVAVTQNGYADGIALNDDDGKEYFVLPEEQNMSFSQFIKNLENKSTFINYIQTQNDNLNMDFEELKADIDWGLFRFAEEAFNATPDAINFWMGDERAVTSMHKDPYENIYCVVSGFKDFILIPPTDYHKVPRKLYPSAQFKTRNGSMDIVPQLDKDGEPVMVQWVAIDPLNPDYDRYPQYRNVNSYHIRVNAGDILYLPALWYHHVKQSHKNISINLWYDMVFDSKYCYYKMIEKLTDSLEFS